MKAEPNWLARKETMEVEMTTEVEEKILSKIKGNVG